MSKLHPIEAAWRRFRNGAGGAWLKRCFEMQRFYLDFMGLRQCPAEVVLPSAVGWNLLALEEARARGEETGTRLSREGLLLANSIHVWAAYRDAKTINEIEPALVECLERSEWPEATPTAALRLPSRCPVLSISWGEAPEHLAVVYDLVTGGEQSGGLELRISLLEGELWLPFSILHLTRPTLAECVDAAAAEARVHGAPEGLVELGFRSDLAGLALTLLLYLAGEPDIVREVHPGERPIKESIRRRDPERYRDLNAPTTYRVGGEFRRAIERWEIEHGEEHGDPTGRGVRPHMRRAHSHLYWTGAGREIPRVRFLLPISVRGGKLVEEPESPSETTVR